MKAHKDKATWILVGANLAIGMILVTHGNMLGLLNVAVGLWIWLG